MDNPILLIIGLITFLIPLLAFFKYIFIEKKYKKIETKDNISGCEMALKLLEANNTNMYVIESNGIYNNYYDINREVIKLDKKFFHKSDIASTSLSSLLAIEALLSKNNKLIKLRAFLLPIVYFLTLFAYVFFIVTVASNSFKYIEYSILTFFIIVIFHLICFSLNCKITKKTKLELKKNRLIKKSEIYMFDEMLESYKYYHLASIYSIVINNIKRLFN